MLVLFDMEYTITEISVKSLLDLIKSERLNLNPSYQRNFIWTPKDQSDLIDTILLGFPLPNLFLYDDGAGKFEMVDGQQRSKTILKFYNGEITSTKETGRQYFNHLKYKEEFLSYRIPIVRIYDLKADESLKDFYVLINKKGKMLNTPELYKSEFHDSRLMLLANEIIEDQKFIELNLFTDSARNRMNDRLFVEELILLTKFGITEKKDELEDLYKADITEIEHQELKQTIDKVLSIIYHLNNSVEKINKTRYRQKNDFYTLFGFIKDNLEQEVALFEYQYKILILLNGIDDQGRQLIRPTNEDCEVLKRYALNCVTQSNSKKARIDRLEFFNRILKSTSEDDGQVIELLNYLSEIFPEKSIQLRNIYGYKLIDLDNL